MIGNLIRKLKHEPEWDTEMLDRELLQEVVDDLKKQLFEKNPKGVEKTKLIYKLCNAYNLLSLTNEPKKKGRWVWVEK